MKKLNNVKNKNSWVYYFEGFLVGYVNYLWVIFVFYWYEYNMMNEDFLYWKTF